ncbi:MAG: sigma 54-interacting transcriptional regulator, partial [Myxococcota bacterium]
MRVLDPERLLDRIIDAAIALSGAERGFIVLCNEVSASVSENDLHIHSGRNLDRESLSGERLSRSIAAQAINSATAITTVDASGDSRFKEALSVAELKLRSVLCLPLRTQGGALGALYLDNRYRAHAFSEADVSLLSAFGDQAAIALANARLVSELDRKARELERMKAEVEVVNQRLETELEARHEELHHARRHPLGNAQHTDGSDNQGLVGKHGMIGRTPAMQRIYRIIERVADKDVTVTILGESGTGKELVARALHQESSTREGPFVPVNCGAIPEQLLESELFGHERGAFTGAVRSKPGLFEIAQSGTLFLDEIGDMPMSMQVKLLRVLQQREFRRVGGTESFETNARVVCATHRDLEARVRDGQFREDLWYRLNVVEIRVPA